VTNRAPAAYATVATLALPTLDAAAVAARGGADNNYVTIVLGQCEVSTDASLFHDTADVYMGLETAAGAAALPAAHCGGWVTHNEHHVYRCFCALLAGGSGGDAVSLKACATSTASADRATDALIVDQGYSELFAVAVRFPGVARPLRAATTALVAASIPVLPWASMPAAHFTVFAVEVDVKPGDVVLASAQALFQRTAAVLSACPTLYVYLTSDHGGTCLPAVPCGESLVATAPVRCAAATGAFVARAEGRCAVRFVAYASNGAAAGAADGAVTVHPSGGLACVVLPASP